MSLPIPPRLAPPAAATRHRLAAVGVAATALFGLLLATDATVLPVALVLLGPPATGVAAARLGWAWRWAAAPWAACGLAMLVVDQVATGEDAAFHAVLTSLMVGLVAAGARLGRRRRR